MRAFSKSLLFTLISVSSYAQDFFPAYEIFDSVCLDQNPGVRDLRKILEKAQSSQVTQEPDKSEVLTNILVEIEPSQPNTENWKSARLFVESGDSKFTGVFEIDVEEKGLTTTYRVERNRVIELMKKLEDIFAASNKWDVEAVYFAKSTPGIYTEEYGFKKMAPSLPSRGAGNINLKLSNAQTDQSVEWDLSQSLIESHVRYQTAEGRNFHKDQPEKCVLLHCRDQKNFIDTSSPEFQKLVEDYNFFLNHIQTLIQSTLSSKPEALPTIPLP